MRKIQINLLVVLLLIAVQAGQLFAQGALMVNPKRVVFDGNKRNDIVSLYNNGEDTSSYAISYKHFHMLENGEFKDLDSAKTDDLLADDIIRFFPKEVTLAPHQSQTIRLQYLKPKDLPAGEYRSHLYFRAVERAKALEEKSADTSNKTISLKLNIVYGIAIPVFVRNQTQPATVSLANMTMSPTDTGGLKVSVDIKRSGNESCYGELILTYKDASGIETELTRAKGVGVYIPLAMRRFAMEFKAPDNVKVTPGGTLKVEYRAMTGADKEPTLGTSELVVK